MCWSARCSCGRYQPRRPLLVATLGLALYALPLVALAVTAPAPVTVASYALAMTGLGFLNPVWQTVVQQEFPPQVLARVTSYDWLLSLAAAPLGYTLAPLAADAWGSTGPLLVTAALVALACGGAAFVPSVSRVGRTADADDLTGGPTGGPTDDLTDSRHSLEKGPGATAPETTRANSAAQEATVGAARRDPTIRT